MIDEIVVVGRRGPHLTPRIVCELIAHEGVVREAYKDSRGIWTWSVGLAESGGFDVEQYRDNPQTLEVCLEAYLEALTMRYLPAVLRAFPGPMPEHELGGLLSFHYNTGAIARLAANGMDFMQWKRPAEIVGRRKAEIDLYRNARWTGDGKALVYERVRKPSYQPDWRSGRRVEVTGIIEGLMA